MSAKESVWPTKWGPEIGMKVSWAVADTLLGVVTEISGNTCRVDLISPHATGYLNADTSKLKPFTEVPQ